MYVFVQKYEKYQRFLSEHFQFLEVKFSVYSNRRVCAMGMTENNTAGLALFSFIYLNFFLRTI